MTSSPQQGKQTLEQLSLQRPQNAEKGALSYEPVMDELKGGEPQFLVDYHDCHQTPSGFHPRAFNSNGSWTITTPLSYMNMPILIYIAELRRGRFCLSTVRKRILGISAKPSTRLR